MRLRWLILHLQIMHIDGQDEIKLWFASHLYFICITIVGKLYSSRTVPDIIQLLSLGLIGPKLTARCVACSWAALLSLALIETPENFTKGRQIDTTEIKVLTTDAELSIWDGLNLFKMNISLEQWRVDKNFNIYCTVMNVCNKGQIS